MENVDAASHRVAAMHQMSPELLRLLLGMLEQEMMHTSINVGVSFVDGVDSPHSY